MMTYDVRFFRPEEFKCPCCGQGQPAQVLVFWLDLFRAAWGSPVKINSGFRCPAHNAEVGGAAKSRHLLGCAADIAPVTGDLGRFKALAWRMFGLPGSVGDPLRGWEVIEYPWGMHVAVPRDEASQGLREATAPRSDIPTGHRQPDRHSAANLLVRVSWPSGRK